jgi:hypothetical protein
MQPIVNMAQSYSNIVRDGITTDVPGYCCDSWHIRERIKRIEECKDDNLS